MKRQNKIYVPENEIISGLLLDRKQYSVIQKDYKEIIELPIEELEFSTFVIYIDSVKRFEKYVLGLLQVTDKVSILLIVEDDLSNLGIVDVPEEVHCILRGSASGTELAVNLKNSATRMESLFNRLVNQKHAEKTYHYDNIIGVSKPMQTVYNMIEKVSNHDVTVLILGESGTGKELVAHALHYNSPRKNGPFIAVNCAALPDDLLESELFGHVKGAFTGAHRDRRGRFELAHKGTIFLDEIAEMSLKTQTKILRVIQDKIIEPVGGESSMEVDVRIIAATNRDLGEEIGIGNFREDLFFRLSVININLPPLRERKEDIYILVSHFLEIFNKKFSALYDELSFDAIEKLMSYNWPGNVRELENTIERACILGHGSILNEGDMILPMKPIKSEESSMDEMIDNFKSLQEGKEYFEKLILQHWLNRNKWNITKTARQLKVQRSSLYKKIEKYSIKK
ncbi:sigma-54-dependent Fis family transcriptional regulator [bacterium]|nr:sigma-54-dependent Fis family transcriptional regulator [bacterium]